MKKRRTSINRIQVEWDAYNVEEALRGGHLEVARWLYMYENAPKSADDRDDAAIEGIVKEALDIGATTFAETVVPKGRDVLEYAMNCKRVEVIERLVDGRYYARGNFSAAESAAESIAKLARTNRLDLIERISTQQNLPPDHSDFWDVHWLEALSTVCRSGNMTLLQWLVEHPMGSDLIEGETSNRTLGGLDCLLCLAVEGGHTNVMEYLTDKGIIDEYRGALFVAIRKGQLNSVEWLVEHFPVAERIPDYCVMNEAAILGHLDILKKLNKLGMGTFVPGWDPVADRDDSESEPALVVTSSNLEVINGYHIQTSWRPTDPMDHAAANGHLEVVQWFHNNRPDVCSSAALDHAAAYGHFEVVQWLLVNRSEVCTAKAMDGAASNGNLDMVKWIHANMNAGCTTTTMDRAARAGHSETLKWLHANRSEGCTVRALENAIERGHLQVARWLQLPYPEFSSAEVNINLDAMNTFEIFLFLHAHYANIFTRSFVQNILNSRMFNHQYLNCE